MQLQQRKILKTLGAATIELSLLPQVKNRTNCFRSSNPAVSNLDVSGGRRMMAYCFHQRLSGRQQKTPKMII
jgi:hypothetical protein